MVFLHEILRLAAEHGTRQARPVGAGEAEVPGVPVVIAVHQPGDEPRYVRVEAVGWSFRPYRRAVYDGEGRVVRPEQEAQLVIRCELPPEPCRKNFASDQDTITANLLISQTMNPHDPPLTAERVEREFDGTYPLDSGRTLRVGSPPPPGTGGES